MIRVVLPQQSRRARRGDRRRAVRRRHPRDGVERPAVPRAGEDPMSIRAAAPAADESCPTAAGRGPDELPIGVGGGWFVRIAIIVIVLLWLIPTVGVLVTSFRPGGARRHHRLVDGARAPVPSRRSGRSRTTATGPRRRWLLERVPQQPRGRDPPTVIPITIAAFAAYAVLVDAVPRPLRPVHARRRAARGAVPDGAHPDLAAVHAGGLDRWAARSSPISI